MTCSTEGPVAGPGSGPGGRPEGSVVRRPPRGSGRSSGAVASVGKDRTVPKAAPGAATLTAVRVAYAIDSLAQGGAERSLVTLVPALVELGVSLAVVVQGDPGVLADEATAAGATVISLGASGRADAVRRCSALLAEHRPDVVHTALFESSVAGRVAAARHGLPVVSSFTSTSYGPEHVHAPGLSPARVRGAQALDAATARLAWRFHTPAAHAADVMARRLGIDRDRIEVIPRARDADALGPTTPERRAAVRAGLGLADDVPVVLALARHEHAKGLDVLLAAAADLRRARPGAVVVVAGREGGDTALLAAAADGLPPGTVRFLGHRDDVGDLLAAADVLALPSRREGLPGVVLEAMAVGTPVVATDLPGTREALGPDLGVLVPVGDPAALAAALGEVLDAPGLAGDPVAARARVRAEFSPPAVARRTVALWARTIADGPPGPVAGVAGRAGRSLDRWRR